MRRIVQLAGLAVELSADDGERWEPIEALFGGCPESSATPALRLRFDERPPEVPDRIPDLTFTGIDVWLGGDGAAARTAFGVAARRIGRDIQVGGPSDATSDATSEMASDATSDVVTAFRRSVQHVLADTLAEHGRYALHAAAIQFGDLVVVALGGTGAGKSTLAYAASRRGWSVLTDDLTFITSDDGRVLAWGLPKALNIPGDLIGRDDRDAAGERGLAIPNDARNRVRVPLENTIDGDAGRVGAVILVEHATGNGHLERIEASPSLLKGLLSSFPLAPDRHRLRELFPSAAALSRLPAWTLYHDADPARRLDVIGTLLDSLVDELAVEAPGA